MDLVAETSLVTLNKAPMNASTKLRAKVLKPKTLFKRSRNIILQLGEKKVLKYYYAYVWSILEVISTKNEYDETDIFVVIEMFASV